jgi:PAS domain S-box-containing protein
LEWDNIDFINFLNSISNRFINVEIEKTDEVINSVLETIIQTTDVQRGYIFLFSKDRQQLKLVYEVCSPDVLPHRGLLESVDAADLKDFVTELQHNREVQVTVSQLPDSRGQEVMKSILRRLDIKTFINIPMFFEKELVGYIGFDSVTSERQWSDSVRYVFRFAGNTIANVLHRKEQHDLLKTVFAQQKAMLDNLPYRAWLKNAEGKYLAVNRYLLDVLKKKKEEVINHTSYDIFPPDQADQIEAADKQVIEQKKQVIQDEMILGTEKVWYKSFRSPVIGDDGSVLGIVGMGVEITEMKKTEEDLKRLNEAKNLLFSTLSHDIRSPIIALNSLMNVLLRNEDKLDKEQRTEYYLLLNRQIEETLFLMENLFQWAGLQKQGIVLNRQKVPLLEMIREAVQTVSVSFEEKKIRLTIPDPSGCTVYVDKNQIITVLRNILSNAVKFTREGGSIFITAGPKNDGVVCLRISDSGIGIPPENQQKLFDEKQRISTRGTNDERGSGLGLLLTKTYLEQNDGTISIESVYGKGTTVILTLPCSEK